MCIYWYMYTQSLGSSSFFIILNNEWTPGVIQELLKKGVEKHKTLGTVRSTCVWTLKIMFLARGKICESHFRQRLKRCELTSIWGMLNIWNSWWQCMCALFQLNSYFSCSIKSECLHYWCVFLFLFPASRTLNDCGQEMCSWIRLDEGIPNGGKRRAGWWSVCLPCASPCPRWPSDGLASRLRRWE